MVTTPPLRPEEVTIVCGCSQQSSQDELAALLDAGVGELFAGYVSERWLGALGMEVSPNRRYFVERQFTDADAFRRAGALARDRGAGFCVTFNEHLYGPEARALLPELVEVALDAGATGLIVADLELMAELRSSLPEEIELIASTEAGCFNAATAALWADRGAQRVIFPRELRLDEMAAMSRDLGGRVSWEAFVAREFCVNSSAVCFASHGYGQRAHFCMAHGGHELVALEGGERHRVPSPFMAHLREPGFAEALRDLHRCGFCAIEPLLGFGVRYLKVPGRSNSALPAVRRLARLLAEGDLSERACREAVGSPAFCAPGVGCYYDLGRRDQITPEVRAPRDIIQNLSRRGRARISADLTPRQPLELTPPVLRVGATRPRPTSFGPARSGVLNDVSRTSPLAAPSEGPALGLYLTLDAARPGDLFERLAAEGIGASVDAAASASPAERHAAERALAQLAALGYAIDTPPRRVYLAQELCPSRLLPPEPWLAGAEEALAAGLAVSAVLPVAYQAYWPALVRLIDALASARLPLELVVSDLGLLGVALRSGLPVELGRILQRMKRDQHAPLPGAERDDPVAQAQRREGGAPGLMSPFWRTWLADAGVTRVGYDVLPTPLSAPLGGLETTLYLPWSYITNSRTCPTAVTLDGAPASLPTTRCGRGCHRYIGEVPYSQLTRAVGQRGTATFLDCSADIEAFVASMEPGPSRIVFEPRLPY